MVASSSFYLAVFLILTLKVLCHGSVLSCQEEDDKLSACVLRLRSAFNSRARAPQMCSEAERFFKCHHSTSISCPDNPLIQDEDFRASVENLKQEVNVRCPREVVEMLCDKTILFHHFATMCHPYINAIQQDTPVFEYCSYSRQYLRCIETANAPCVGTNTTLDQVIHRTKKGLKQDCPGEESGDSVPNLIDNRSLPDNDMGLMQGDAPAEDNEVISVVFDEGNCTLNDIGARIALCSRHLLLTLGAEPLSNKYTCRYQRRYLQCIRRLMLRCPSAQNLQETVYDPFKSSMVNLCEVNSDRCPFDVMNGDITVPDYCTVSENGHEAGSIEYCRIMLSIRKCFRNTWKNCRHRGIRNRHIEPARSSVLKNLNDFCSSELEERSIDLDVEERGSLFDQIGKTLRDTEESYLVGQAGNAGLYEGNEIEELESVVNVFQSLK